MKFPPLFLSLPALALLLVDAQAGVTSTSATDYDFVLDLTASPQGYDISQINSFSGWNDARAGQAYTISFSTVGDPSFTAIHAVSVAANNESLVTHVFDDTGALLGTSVDVIRFSVGG